MIGEWCPAPRAVVDVRAGRAGEAGDHDERGAERFPAAKINRFLQPDSGAHVKLHHRTAQVIVTHWCSIPSQRLSIRTPSMMSCWTMMRFPHPSLYHEYELSSSVNVWMRLQRVHQWWSGSRAINSHGSRSTWAFTVATPSG